MNDYEARETRVNPHSHPNAEQRGILTDVVVPVAQAAIPTVGTVIAAKIVANGNGDGKK